MTIQRIHRASTLIRNRDWHELSRRLQRRFRRLSPDARVATYWDDARYSEGKALLGRYWWEVPGMAERWNRMVTGDPHLDHYRDVAQRYLAPRQARIALTLGCGSGHNERKWAAEHRFDVHDAIDISMASIAEAKSLAAHEGLPQLRYTVGDLNHLTLTPAHYDVIFAEHSLHHVAALEHLMAQVSQALKPGGLLIVDEFVGPSRFQWTDRQLTAITGTLSILPESLRRSRTQEGVLKRTVPRPTIKQMLEIDPSEAVRSAEIPALLRQHTHVLEWRPYGGALLHLLLEDIAGNFSLDDDQAMAWRDWCFDLEDRLMQSGELDTDFVFAICQLPE